jgi:hypothetical protein
LITLEVRALGPLAPRIDEHDPLITLVFATGDLDSLPSQH